MLIVGISAFYHDSAVSVIKDGEILFSAQEERFSRKKHDGGFPHLALKNAFDFLQIKASDVDGFVFYEKPFLKFERLIENYVAFAPKGFASFVKFLPVWLKDKLFQKDILVTQLLQFGLTADQAKQKIYFSEHHLSHAASAFYPSGFKDALVLTMDGVGEWETTTVYRGVYNKLELIKKIDYPHSLGLFYSAFTYYCGFKVNSGEYKLMGLAPYGKPRFAETIKAHLIDIKADGSFRLNLKYFSFQTDLVMTNKLFDQLFGGVYRKPESQLEQVHMDIAASVQAVLEEIVLKIVKSLKNDFPAVSNLCLAGGVALNCVANGVLTRSGLFENIWIQPAAGDAGGSLGAAMAYYSSMSSKSYASSDQMCGAYLGTQYTDEQIEKSLVDNKIIYRKLDQNQLRLELVDALIHNKAIGMFQGRMEFGPRALGNRSILANPISMETQKDLNLKIKFRESFRPFAPAILEDHVSDWFEFVGVSPYMLNVAYLKQQHRISVTNSDSLFGLELLKSKRSVIPAVTHVDYSARLQTVSKNTNEFFYNLIQSFYEKTGVPILVNTSFNVRGEPIVESPSDAIRCFLGTDLDLLCLGSYIVLKVDQPRDRVQAYHDQFDLD